MTSASQFKKLTLVGGGFSSGKSDRRGASFNPTSLTSPRAGAAARAATEEEGEDLRERRPIIGAGALVDVDATAFREADGDACTPRMLMARILIGRCVRLVWFRRREGENVSTGEEDERGRKNWRGKREPGVVEQQAASCRRTKNESRSRGFWRLCRNR